MKCKCGETDIEFTMSAVPVKRLGGEEVAYFHNGTSCGWAYECQDCWPEHTHASFGPGLESKSAAETALRRHIAFYCPPNWQAMSEDERAHNLEQRVRWESMNTQLNSARYAQAVRDGWDG